MVTVQRARIEDLADILALQKMAFKDHGQVYCNCLIPPLTQTLSEIENEFKQKVFLKAIVNRNIVGSVRGFTRNDYCHIEKLVVDPDFQNRGIGKLLMIEIEKLFADTKLFKLWTGRDDDKNLYFYKKLGYKIVEDKQARNVPAEIVYLEKRAGK